MIRQKSILSLTVVMLVLAISYQKAEAQTAKQKVTFSSANEVGLVTGAKGEAFMLQTVNGFKKNKWFAGVGVGFDFYGQRTIPLFLNYRQALLDKRNTPFLYGSSGIDFAWLNSLQKAALDVASSSPGYFYDFGAGWKLTGKNGHAFVLSAGYSVKQVKYTSPMYSIFSMPQLEEETYNRYNYLYRRIVIKVGFQL